MNVVPIMLATAGHVDHGKSALVKALTGIDPDRLPEEKSRGITIDLGFAHFDVQSREAASSVPVTFRVGIVDVPGHEDFVKNMAAGVGAIDAALLVVAADDGWMPQTEEHFQILQYLGVSRGLVALTKTDLVESVTPLEESIRGKLAGTSWSEVPIIPTSTVREGGVAQLRTALAELFSCCPTRRDLGKPRLPVDRAFVLRGIGQVVTGTLFGGVLRANDPVMLQPSGTKGRIRSIQCYNAPVEASFPGMRTALSIPDLNAEAGSLVERGEVVTRPELGLPSSILDAVLFRSARFNNRAPQMKHGMRVKIHLGAGCSGARVLLAKGAELKAGESAIAQIRTEKPLFGFVGDRFIIRDWSERWTLAGGEILEAAGNERNFRRENHQAFLEERAANRGNLETLLETLIQRDQAVRLEGILRQSLFSDAEIQSTAERLCAAGRLVKARGWLLDPLWWKGELQRAVDAIETAHRAHPELPGALLAELRTEIALPVAELFEVLTEALMARGYRKTGLHLHRQTHQPALPERLRSAGGKVRQALNAKPLDPPSRKELAPDAASLEALKFLVQTGQAVELGDGSVLSVGGYDELRKRAVAFLSKKRQATASELRQALETSRRILIPFLEKLDKEGVTVRRGDVRELRKS